MQADIEFMSKIPNKLRHQHILARTWQEFTDRAMDLLVQNPTTSKFVMKYIPKTHKFILRVTDGTRLVIRKCSGEELAQVQKFTTLAGRAFTNEGNRKTIDEGKGEEDKAKKKAKNKKKR